MKIAVLSGKGGAGKTLVSVNLACINDNSIYADCDVEEPNGHLFFKPLNNEKEEVSVSVPVIDIELCASCRKCVDFCKFNALAFVNKVIVFEEICHSCGGCSLVCPNKAITEKQKTIGCIECGTSQSVKVISGVLNTGEASGVPLVKKILNKIKDATSVFIDCPPGSACVVIESIKDADYCILVAEPTLFGAHNLEMVYELVSIFNKKCGVVLNKVNGSCNPSEKFCKAKGIDILLEIPFDMELGRINSNGDIAVRESQKYRDMFCSLYQKIVKEAENETAVNP